MPRHLIIVSRDDPELYGHLLERFDDDKNVQIILDRRSGHDRRLPTPASTPPDVNRRESDRRTRRLAEDDLQSRRHAIVTIADDL